MSETILRPAARLPGDTQACDVFQAHDEVVAELRARLIPQPHVTALAETFKVLGDPTRVRILNALSAAELCVCDIATLLRLGESAVSHERAGTAGRCFTPWTMTTSRGCSHKDWNTSRKPRPTQRPRVEGTGEP